MKVRTLSPITTPDGEVPAGWVVIIPDEVFPRLRGKVEPAGSLLISWRTKSGRLIYLAEDQRRVDAVPPGNAVFTLAELNAMRGLDREAAERLIDIKESFPGSDILDVEPTSRELSRVRGP